MEYKTLENRLRSKNGGISKFDDWIVDCGNDIVTKIIAFNFFVDIHLKTLNDIDLFTIMDELEKRLQGKNHIKPNERLKKVIYPFIKEAWNSPETKMESCKKISTIMSSSSILRDFENVGGDNHGRIKIGIDEILLNLEENSRRGNGNCFKKENNIVWFTDAQKLDMQFERSPSADEIRDLLGLYIYNQELIEVRFDSNINTEPRKPTIFHSEFMHHWKPTLSEDGWGITLNTSNFNDGVGESVFKVEYWPQSTFKKLGVCSDGINEDGWDIYFQKRVDEFRLLANSLDNKFIVIDDLEYFLNKLKAV